MASKKNSEKDGKKLGKKLVEGKISDSPRKPGIVADNAVVKKVSVEDDIAEYVVNSIDREGLKDRIKTALKDFNYNVNPIKTQSQGKRKLIIKNPHSPGDVVMMTAAIRDLHQTYPGEYKTDVRCACLEVFEGNPYITPIKDGDPDSAVIRAEYPLIHDSNEGSYHFIHGYRKHLESCIGRTIKQGKMKPDLYIRDEERSWFSAVKEIAGDDRSFWVVDAGWKNDFTAKQWATEYFQEVVDYFKDKIQFVQIGHKQHNHPILKGVINLVGKTDLRQLIRLVYHSVGVLTPVSLPMVLAAGVPNSFAFPKSRACVVVAGGREPVQWQAYPTHRYLHTEGTMDCCDLGGCWKSRVEKLGDGDKTKENSLCLYPTKVGDQTISGCMARIMPMDVIREIKRYYEGVGSVFKYGKEKTVEV